MLLSVEVPSALPLCQPSRQMLQADPVFRAVRDVMAHGAKLGTVAQVGRLRRECLAMCLAMAGESAWRVTRHSPAPWEYAAQRPFNGAMACLSAVDVVGGYELSAEEYDAPAIRALTISASRLILHANDIYSAAKESVTHAARGNLPALLADRHGESLQEGVARTVHLHNRQVDEYLALEPEAAYGGSAQVARYLADLRSWIRGSLEWHSLTGRYHNRPGRPTVRDRTDAPAALAPTAGSGAPDQCLRCGSAHENEPPGSNLAADDPLGGLSAR